jgi:hypothetical protein
MTERAKRAGRDLSAKERSWKLERTSREGAQREERSLSSRAWQEQFFPPRLMVQPNFNLAANVLICTPDGVTCSSVPQDPTARSLSVCTYSQEGLDFHN